MKRARHSLFTPIFERRNGRWEFSEYFTTGKRRQISRRTQEEAFEARNDLAAHIAKGRKDLATSTATELAEFRSLRARMSSSVTVSVAVEEFIEEKRKDGDAKKKWLRVLGDYLRTFKGQWADVPMPQVTKSGMEAWMRNLGLPQRSWNNLRSAIVQLARWAREKGYLPEGMTEAERIKRFKIKKTSTITHWEPEELQQQLDNASADDRVWYLLGSFAGVRTEEMMPEYKDKDPLRWEDFDWTEGIIRMRPETSKVNEARNVPISEQLAAWLQPYLGRKGPCIPIGRRPRVITRRVKAAGGLSHKVNAHRHSYGTYRRMEVKNIEQVAEEMGTGIYKVKINYSRPKNPSALEKWKAILPKGDTKVIALSHHSLTKKKKISAITAVGIGAKHL